MVRSRMGMPSRGRRMGGLWRPRGAGVQRGGAVGERAGPGARSIGRPVAGYRSRMERTAIERAARLAGLALDAETDIDAVGADPVLASPFHLGEGAATALALVGQEVGRIWEMRCGRRQRMAVDVRHAAASLHSFALLRLEGGDTPTPLRRVSPL